MTGYKVLSLDLENTATQDPTLTQENTVQLQHLWCTIYVKWQRLLGRHMHKKGCTQVAITGPSTLRTQDSILVQMPEDPGPMNT